MTMKKVKKFVEEHKAQTAAAAVAVAGIAIWLITKDKPSNYVEVSKPELNTGEWINLYKGIKGKYKDSVSGMVTAVDVADLGEFGKKLTAVEGIGEHEPIRFIFGTERSFT